MERLGNLPAARLLDPEEAQEHLLALAEKGILCERSGNGSAVIATVTVGAIGDARPHLSGDQTVAARAAVDEKDQVAGADENTPEIPVESLIRFWFLC